MMGLASISSVTAVLIILGFVLIIVLNVNSLAFGAKETFDEVVVYLLDDTDEKQIEEMGKAFKKIDGVMEVSFQTKDYALEQLKKDLGDEAYILEDLKRNPLPNTYIIQLEDVSKSEYVEEKIQSFEGVEGIRYYDEAVDKLIKIADFIKKIGGWILLILLLISVFIISNTIKVTVLNRHKEIELMQYVGATNGYVRGPFMIEGIMLGFIGSLIAILIISFSYNYILNYLSDRYMMMMVGMSGYIVGIDMILKDLIIIFLTMGIGIGVLGSLISLKKFLSV